MKRLPKLACGLMLVTALGFITACGDGGKQPATDTTGKSTDSLMSNTGANGNATPAALPGDSTHPDSLRTDTGMHQ